jgi:hypothetical protein
MAQQVEAWLRPEVTEKVWDILDILKSIDEDMLKDWIRENWPDPEDIYS